MKTNKLVLLFGLIVSLFFVACNGDELLGDDDINIDDITDVDDQIVLNQTLNLPNQLFDYSVSLPDHLDNNNIRNEDNEPNNNRVTNSGATLGRVLFYDAKLSGNNTVACASCHLQDAGFSDPDRFSVGFEGGLTGRNSMGIANARYYRNGRFFWDERANTLEDQVLLPIQDHVEMGMTLDVLVPKLQNEAYYNVLFTQAFGNETVTEDRISDALAQFVRSIVSFDSKYDQGLAQLNNPPNNNTNIPGFTNQENQGRRLFNQLNCDNCHRTDLFVGDEARNNGLDAIITDNGLGNVTGNANDNGKFKVPSLRNIGLTAPYMHDGRFATLEQVVEHYNSGVQASATLDNRLRGGGQGGQGQPRRLNLSNADKAALVAFMETFTDPNLATEEKYSNPFRE